MAKERLQSSFLQSKDPNLIYLGLTTLKELLITNKSLIIQYKDIVIKHFNSDDFSLKNRALEIIKVTTTSDNL